MGVQETSSQPNAPMQRVAKKIGCSRFEDFGEFIDCGQKRLDFMAADSGSAANSEKGIGVLEGVANARMARQNRALPHSLRDHRRSGVSSRINAL